MRRMVDGAVWQNTGSIRLTALLQKCAVTIGALSVDGGDYSADGSLQGLFMRNQKDTAYMSTHLRKMKADIQF